MPFADKHFSSLGLAGFHRIAYREWGDPGNPRVLICVHGLSRNRKDFDTIAEALADRWRVLAPDMPGRGDSEWLADKAHYGYPLYHRVCAGLLARAGVEEVDWLGTSMGGHIGMDLAAMPGSPIRRLVLNDIGPHVPAEGRAENQRHFGTDPRFASEEEATRHVRETRTAFGPFSEEMWIKFARDSLRRLPDGQWTLHYDPGLRSDAPIVSTEKWEVWERIACPVLTIWGTASKLLTAETVERMKATGPKTALYEVPGVGHCPGLTTEAEITAVRRFLER